MKISSAQTHLYTLKSASGDQIQKISFQQYEEEPTLIFLKSSKNTFNSINLKSAAKDQSNQKLTLKPVAFQQNLLQSSLERSHASVYDEQFVFQYLTPIKKQSCQQLLFTDQIKEKGNSKTKKTKTNQHSKTAKPPKQHNILNQQQQSAQHQSNFVKCFEPPCLIDQIGSNSRNSNRSSPGLDSNLQCKSGVSPINQMIFSDSEAQVNFLKSNNSKLFRRLQAQIQKCQQLEHQIQLLLNKNSQLIQANSCQSSIIKQLKNIIANCEREKRKFIAKEWEEFQFVKEILFQKKKSSTKTKSTISHNLKNDSSHSVLPQNPFQQNKISHFQNFSKAKKQSTSPQKSYVQNGKAINHGQDLFPDKKISLRIEQKNKFQSDQKSSENKIHRNLSFQNVKPGKKLNFDQQNNHINKILQSKLLVKHQQNQKNWNKKSSQSSYGRIH